MIKASKGSRSRSRSKVLIHHLDIIIISEVKFFKSCRDRAKVSTELGQISSKSSTIKLYYTKKKGQIHKVAAI